MVILAEFGYAIKGLAQYLKDENDSVIVSGAAIVLDTLGDILKSPLKNVLTFGNEFWGVAMDLADYTRSDLYAN